MLRLAALAGLLLLLGTAGCAFPFQPSAEPQECPTALLEGTLVRDDETALAVHSDEVNVTYPIQWPAGWGTRHVDGVRQLLDASGSVVGSEGDQFSAGGGFTPGPNEVFQPCGPIEVVPGRP